MKFNWIWFVNETPAAGGPREGNQLTFLLSLKKEKSEVDLRWWAALFFILHFINKLIEIEDLKKEKAARAAKQTIQFFFSSSINQIKIILICWWERKELVCCCPIALPLNKLNFQFNCWLPSLFPRFVEISFFNFKRRLGQQRNKR